MEGSSHRNKISIHPPREGWDPCSMWSRAWRRSFQSTHPVRGGTGSYRKRSYGGVISIHPPREGWDAQYLALLSARGVISIHPPREGWDCRACPLSALPLRFQSTHPVRGGTGNYIARIILSKFQSTHPVRGGTRGKRCWARKPLFQSTHPVRGGTLLLRFFGRSIAISIHPPREGWDRDHPQRMPCAGHFNPPTP